MCASPADQLTPYNVNVSHPATASLLFAFLAVAMFWQVPGWALSLLNRRKLDCLISLIKETGWTRPVFENCPIAPSTPACQ
jgi:hypothetical protein